MAESRQRVTGHNSEPQIESVAALVASLDRETAETLLGRFPSELEQRVRRAVAELQDIPDKRKREISADFYQVLRGADRQPAADPEVPTLPANQTDRPKPEQVPPQDDGREPEPLPSQCGSRSSQLVSSSLDQLAKLLRKEHPQTIAAILSTLIPQRAARLMLTLPPGQQYEVVRRIAQMDRTDLESLVEIERELQDQIQRADEQTRLATDGWQAVQSILMSADTTARQDIMNNLERFDMKLANRLRGRQVDAIEGDAGTVQSQYLTAVAFDRLADLDDEVLGHVFRLVPRETTMKALAGASHGCLKDLMNKLPEDVASGLRMDLAAIGPLRLGDIHQAQALLVTTARQVVNTSALSAPDRLRVSA